MGSTKEVEAIKAVIAKFPVTFGLKAFPGDVFRIGLQQSYFRGPGECGGELMLYTQRWKGRTSERESIESGWVDFAKGTEEELRRNIKEV